MLPILYSHKDLIIYSYPLMMGVAWGISYHLIMYLLEKNKKSTKGFMGLFIGTFLASWIGAKVFFLLFSSLGEYEKLLSSTSFWLGGGFVFYGGLVFGAVFVLIYSLLLKKFDFKSTIFILPGVCISHAIGRIGCFLAGCCYGKETDFFLGIHLHDSNRHPVQLYETFLLVLMSIILIGMISKKINYKKLILFYFISYSFLRFIIEFFRGDSIRGIATFGLSLSQWTSLSLIFGFLILGFVNYLKKKEFNE